MVKTPLGNDVCLVKELNHKPILIIGCFHGDEPQGKYLITEYLKFVKNTQLMFIPCLNPDGLDENTRVNSRGVDLNRNFPTKNWTKSEKNEFFGGEFPASEIETQFLIEIIETYKPKIILTLHAPFKIVNYDGNAKLLAEEISKIMDYPVQKSIGYETPGSFGTWAGIEKGIPTITLELDETIPVENLKAPMFEVFKMLENYKI